MIRIYSSLKSFQIGALGAAAVLTVISPCPQEARALVVTVNSTQYDVTTFSGSYSNSNAKFSSVFMPWYGNTTLTQNFAAAVGAGLGYVNDGSINSPYFADSFSSNQVNMWYTFISDPSTIRGANIPRNDSYEWAEAVAVPGPVPILGIPVVVAYCRKLKERIKARRDTSSVSSV